MRIILIPMIDTHFHTKSAREHGIMAGLSMGSGQTLNITLWDYENRITLSLSEIQNLFELPPH